MRPMTSETMTGSSTARPGGTAGKRQAFGRGASLVEWAQKNGLFFALLALVILFSVTTQHFATAANARVILMQVALVGIMAVPAAMLILSGYVDLSVGGIMVLSAVVFGMCMQAGTGLPVAIAAAFAAAITWGLFNAVSITVWAFSPIVVTLGGLVGARGLAQFLTQGMTNFGFGPQFALLGNGTLLSMPVPVVIFAVIFLAGLHVWYRTPYGRHMMATGGAQEAAKALGIRTVAIPFWLYTMSAATAALCGLISASQLDSAAITIGTGAELDVLTGVLLGGVAFSGGRGSLFGVLYGVLFIGALRNGLVQINVSAYFHQFSVGLALIFAAGLDILYQRLERLRTARAAVAPHGGQNGSAAEGASS
ncbi:MAG: ABC transporter permease [Mesorhizobium sp.]|nr:MAG: ABC transporter permease [Mesorhizobium sp.]TJU97178.1 MAG: ABC transporter permease [Mesorhizobium sp.]